MKLRSVMAASMVLLATGSLAATVQYQHPAVTIVAENEPLESVLTALSEAMNLQVTSQLGLNPIINCDIQNQPLKQAFKNLLGELSYSLVWADDGEHLMGLVILTGDTEATVVTESTAPAAANNGDHKAPAAAATPQPHNAGQSTAVTPGHDVDNTLQRTEQEAQLAAERQEQEARMAEEEAAREAEMAIVRQEEEAAHEAQMVEERIRREADMEALAESLGLPPLRK